MWTKVPSLPEIDFQEGLISFTFSLADDFVPLVTDILWISLSQEADIFLLCHCVQYFVIAGGNDLHATKFFKNSLISDIFE